MTQARLILAAVLACLLVLPASSAGAAVPRSFFGVMADGPLLDGPFDLGRETRLMRSSGAGTVRVAVEDTSSSHPVPRRASDGDRSGRGLALVTHLAERWGVDDLDVGKEVWFELRV